MSFLWVWPAVGSEEMLRCSGVEGGQARGEVSGSKGQEFRKWESWDSLPICELRLRDVVGSRAKPNVIPPCFSLLTFEWHSRDRAWTHVTRHDSRFPFLPPSMNPCISAGRLRCAFLLSTVENFHEAFGGSIVVRQSASLCLPQVVCVGTAMGGKRWWEALCVQGMLLGVDGRLLRGTKRGSVRFGKIWILLFVA